MIRFTSGTTFAVCLILALTADGWADKPLPALAGAGIVLGAVMALTGLARGMGGRLSRRNLQKFQGAELALKMEDAIAEKAKKNLVASTGGANPRPLQESEKVAPVHTVKTLAQMAGLSRDTARQGQIQKKTVRRYQHQTVKRNKQLLNYHIPLPL